MPEQLRLATVATCVVLGGVVLGGAYALAHDGPAEPARAPASPTTIRLEDRPIGELRRVSPLPALVVPRPRPKPAAPQAVVQAPPAAVVPAATPAPVSAPAPTPAPTPKPPARKPAKKPQTFDDSG